MNVQDQALDGKRKRMSQVILDPPGLNKGTVNILCHQGTNRRVTFGKSPWEFQFPIRRWCFAGLSDSALLWFHCASFALCGSEDNGGFLLMGP